jgi:hypothetical protein
MLAKTDVLNSVERRNTSVATNGWEPHLSFRHLNPSLRSIEHRFPLACLAWVIYGNGILLNTFIYHV